MSVGHLLLDELCFAPAKLPAAASWKPNPSPTTTSALTVRGSHRTLQFGLPYFIHDLGPMELGDCWNALCGHLRRHELPMFAPAKSLVGVPAAAVPARFGRRFLAEPIDASELKSADAFELSCCTRARQHWAWPSEWKLTQLNAALAAVRQAAGSDTPIGVGLPLNCHIDDLIACISADVDFIHLIGRVADLDASDLRCVVACRQLTQRLQRPQLPILVSAALSDVHQSYKLLALGATAVCLDNLLLPIIEKSIAALQDDDTAGGMLRGLTNITARKAPELTEVSTALTEFKRQLEAYLERVGAPSLMELTRDCLRSCSERAHGVTGVAALG